MLFSRRSITLAPEIGIGRNSIRHLTLDSTTSGEGAAKHQNTLLLIIISACRASWLRISVSLSVVQGLLFTIVTVTLIAHSPEYLHCVSPNFDDCSSTLCVFRPLIILECSRLRAGIRKPKYQLILRDTLRATIFRVTC
jgi:hypothetical protein